MNIESAANRERSSLQSQEDWEDVWLQRLAVEAAEWIRAPGQGHGKLGFC